MRKKEGEEKRITQEEMLLEAAQTDPEKAMCAVTGLPAIYRDPKTGLPYANKEAFKIIRERFAKENNFSKKDNSMGFLSDATYEQGFTRKRTRSVIPHDRQTSYVRQFSNYRKIPAPEIEDSD
ncbi:swr1 complex subunit 2 [Phtheirospermum japonicum]|uniref:Swr1 complex subunit 2 n=1 Tax=Phtheirospermum japonicum TaxID=374723 RepID=A0A830DBG7_9LAMI|nr:swr1 complex subunit 2 [Phtheirospermum japonicum]